MKGGGMAREEKRKAIEEIADIFKNSTSVVFTDYRGLSNAELTALRKKLRAAEIGYRVVKNTLARLASQKVEKEYLAEVFNGPVAMAFGDGELNEPASILLSYIKGQKLELEITGGYADNRLLSQDEVTTLSKLPSRDILITRVLVGMKNPVYSLVNCLSGPMRGLVGVLQARVKQMEGV
jgi:large subunit ribosomal protein L10